MPMSYTGDEEDEQKTPKDQVQGDQDALTARQSAASAPQQFNYQKTYQQPQTPVSQPGQQTAMPWSGQAPTLATGGATPWQQNMQKPMWGAPVAAPQAAGQQMPDWNALRQRFGGGGMGVPQGPQGQQVGQDERPGMPGHGGGMGGFMQQIAARMAARRAAIMQAMQQRGGFPGMQPGAAPQQGFAAPQGGVIPGDRRMY